MSAAHTNILYRLQIHHIKQKTTTSIRKKDKKILTHIQSQPTTVETHTKPCEFFLLWYEYVEIFFFFFFWQLKLNTSAKTYFITI